MIKMDRFPKTVMFSVLLMLMLMSLIGASKAENCSTYTFTNRGAFANCTSLPVLNAFLHWNYHLSNRTIDIAYRHTQITSPSWLAWASNPTGGGMMGKQSLVVFVGSKGSVRAYTSGVGTTSLQPCTLMSFGVPSISAEFVDDNQIVIFATLQLLEGGQNFSQLWQHGEVRGDTGREHTLDPENPTSVATVNLLLPNASLQPYTILKIGFSS